MPDVKEQVNRVERELTEQELAFEHIDDSENPVIALSFGGGDFSFTHLVVHLVFDEDGASAQIATSPVTSAPVEKAARVLLALNDLNSKYRWVKFFLDSDNDVIVNADVVFNEENVAQACVEMLVRTVNIIDETYSDVMKALWS